MNLAKLGVHGAELIVLLSLVAWDSFFVGSVSEVSVIKNKKLSFRCFSFFHSILLLYFIASLMIHCLLNDIFVIVNKKKKKTSKSVHVVEKWISKQVPNSNRYSVCSFC